MGTASSTTAIMNPQITNLVIILVMMQASKKIPFEDENVLWGVRGLYILSNVIIFGVYMYVKMQIDKKRGKSSTILPLPRLSVPNISPRQT